ncbi:MAG: NifB/NifX family molybdenum-iron cluster-binding protein [Thermodesulfobacteriota bacterium]
MKIAISSTGKNLDSQIDPRFGRCQYFIFIDPETMEFETFENEGLMAMGGAGVQAAQFIAQKGAKALITGNIGPNAASALYSSGIKVYMVSGGTVKEVVEKYKSGNLNESSGPTVPPHFGMGGGRGMGGRRGI